MRGKLHMASSRVLIHPLFYLPAVSILMLCPDAMHLLDLGVSHHILGNVFFEIVYERRYFPNIDTLEARCNALWDKIAAQYARRQTPVQMGNLEISFFADTRAPHRHFPLLSSRIKAAETRPIQTEYFENDQNASETPTPKQDTN